MQAQVRSNGTGMTLYTRFYCLQLTKKQSALMNWEDRGTCYVRYESPGNFWLSLLPFADTCCSWACTYRKAEDGCIRIADQAKAGKPMRNHLRANMRVSNTENIGYPEMKNLGSSVWFADYNQAISYVRRDNVKVKVKTARPSLTPIKAFIESCVSKTPALQPLMTNPYHSSLLADLQRMLVEDFGEIHEVEYLAKQCQSLYKTKNRGTQLQTITQTQTAYVPPMASQEYGALKERVSRLEEEVATLEDRMATRLDNYYAAAMQKAEQLAQANAALFG